MKVLVVTPMQQERDLFLLACAKRGFDAQSYILGRLPIESLPHLGIMLACGGTGKAQFAVQTQHLLDVSTQWELVVCAGAAGALADGLSIGDVVLATTTVEHDYNNKFNDRPIPTFEGAPGAIAELRRLSLSFASFNVRFGIVASGDEDIVNMDRKMALRQSTNALAVAWEGAGGARACKFSGVPFIEIRGITDIADHGAPSDFDANLAVAMDNVATLVTSWLGNHADRRDI